MTHTMQFNMQFLKLMQHEVGNVCYRPWKFHLVSFKYMTAKYIKVLFFSFRNFRFVTYSKQAEENHRDVSSVQKLKAHFYYERIKEIFSLSIFSFSKYINLNCARR